MYGCYERKQMLDYVTGASIVNTTVSRAFAFNFRNILNKYFQNSQPILRFTKTTRYAMCIQSHVLLFT